MSRIEHQIEALIAPALQAKGIEIVLLRLIENQGRKTLQVLLENSATHSITIEECARASRTISALLDVDDTIKGAFHLEVSSPGIDRPLVKAADYARYIGHEAKIELEFPQEGRKRFRGLLKAVEENSKVVITVDGEDYAIDIESVGAAKLVLTDRLIKEFQDARKQQEDAASAAAEPITQP